MESKWRLLKEFPNIPIQERWQDIDNVSVNFGITYCPGFGPHNMERSSTPPEPEHPPMVDDLARDEGTEAEDFALSHDLTATSTARLDVSATDPSSGSTLAGEGQASSTAMAAMPAMSFAHCGRDQVQDHE
eukprot:5443276-Amphidinium_carterae.3